MNDSCAIGLPGQRMIGTRVRFVISSVSDPRNPGSTKPAVAWTMSPKRPRLLFPSIRLTMSSGISTTSSVRPRTNSPGWITKDSSSEISTISVRLSGGAARSIAGTRKLWKTRNVRPRRRSTEAGWTIAGFQGSILIRPSSTRRRIVPSERTEVGIGPGVFQELRLVLARPGDRYAHAGGRGRMRITVGAAARRAREGPARMRWRAAAAVARFRQWLLVALLDRPPHDVQQHRDGDLQNEHQPDEAPTHA